MIKMNQNHHGRTFIFMKFCRNTIVNVENMMIKRLIAKFRKALFNSSRFDELLNKEAAGIEQRLSSSFRKDIVKNQYLQLYLNCEKKGVVDTLYNGKRIVVSFTTYGMRINDVHLVIESIMQQTLKPNKIILWLDQTEFTEHTIPASLKELKTRGLEICFFEDIKSYNKLIPALRNYPNDIIITIDDDVIYPIDLIDRLYHQHVKYPNEVICTHAHIISFSKEGVLLPYELWPDPPTDRSRSSKSFLPLGIGGVLYPPKCLHDDVFKKEIFMSLSPMADDLWFKIMALRNGTSCRTTPIYENFDSWIVPINRKDDIRLFDTNAKMNLVQLKNLMNEYGLDQYSFDVCETTSERIIPELYEESVEQWILFLKHKYAYELALSFIKETDRVLEIGCGDGYGAILLSDSGANVVAIDVDNDSISYAKRKYDKENLSFELYDGKVIDYPSQSFDVIVSFQVIEHVTDVKAYLNNIKRLLKSEGLLIITTPNRTYRLTAEQKPWNEFHLREYDLHSLMKEVLGIIPDSRFYAVKACDEIQSIEKERCRSSRADYNETEFHYVFKRANYKEFYSTKDFFISQDDIDDGLDLLVSNRMICCDK